MIRFSAGRCLAGAVGVVLGGFGSVDFETAPSQGGVADLKLAIGVETAEAGPIARGVARRTTRRVVRRATIAGCAFRAPYYNCSGIYYDPVIESGKTVYISVDREVVLSDGYPYYNGIIVEKRVTVEY